MAPRASIARRLIENAELVVGGARHLALAGALRGERLAWPSPMDAAFTEIVARRGRAVTVVASGDPFHYGVGKQLAALVDADEILCVPHASPVRRSAARMGAAGHGDGDAARPRAERDRALSAAGCPHPGAGVGWHDTAMLARLLTERGMGKSHITVLECMGGARERVRSAEADAFALDRIDALNTIAVKIVTDAQSAVIPLSPGLDDTVYEHDGQLTKREIRAISLSSLAPRAGELLWDIGLGAGSIAIEWLLRHPSLRAIGIEQRADRAAHAARNAAALGTPDLTIIEGRAPEGLEWSACP